MTEQFSMLEETRKEKIKKQIKQAINLEVNLYRSAASMPWSALSDRLTVLQ